MKILINHSNHPSDKWHPAQKEGWDKIIDLPFPNIDPHADTRQVADLVTEYYVSLELTISKQDGEVWLMLQGEFTYCYLLYERVRSYLIYSDYARNFRGLAIPTTERRVVENPDGTKTSTFEFVRWRLLERRV